MLFCNRIPSNYSAGVDSIPKYLRTNPKKALLGQSGSISEIIFNLAQKFEYLSPYASKIILGDFINCPTKKGLRTYYQYVNCPTRKNKTLDICFGTVKHTFTESQLPPLGASDNSVVYPHPVSEATREGEALKKNKIKKITITKRSVKVWNNDSIMALHIMGGLQ